MALSQINMKTVLAPKMFSFSLLKPGSGPAVEHEILMFFECLLMALQKSVVKSVVVTSVTKFSHAVGVFSVGDIFVQKVMNPNLTFMHSMGTVAI